jgi:hypothetical protein
VFIFRYATTCIYLQFGVWIYFSHHEISVLTLSNSFLIVFFWLIYQPGISTLSFVSLLIVSLAINGVLFPKLMAMGRDRPLIGDSMHGPSIKCQVIRSLTSGRNCWPLLIDNDYFRHNWPTSVAIITHLICHADHCYVTTQWTHDKWHEMLTTVTVPWPLDWSRLHTDDYSLGQLRHWKVDHWPHWPLYITKWTMDKRSVQSER